MDFFNPGLAPFSIALMIFGLIVFLELAGLLFGIAFSGILDNLLPDIELAGDADIGELGDIDGAELDGPAAGPLTHFLSWLCVGKVPILILFAAFLTGFGLSGLVLQSLSEATLGSYLPALIAAVPAFFAALPITRHMALALARILPSDTTDAVSTDTFIGRTAVIVRGVAKRGAPAEAKLKDARGTTQYILVEPDADDASFEQGVEILLVEKNGAVFRAIENDHPALSGD